jgi:hypothetical protein
MSFIINVFPNEPIVLAKFWGHTGAQEDYPQMLRQLGRRLAGKNGPIYRINDFTELDMTNLGDVVVALDLEYRSGVPGSSTDPRIRTILVTTSDLIEFGAHSVQQDQYGHQDPSPIFDSVDDALRYCRAEIERESVRRINQTA